MAGTAESPTASRVWPWSTRSPRPRHWARARRENPLARFIPFSSLVSPHDVMTRGGDLLRIWRLDGVPFECEIGRAHV